MRSVIVGAASVLAVLVASVASADIVGTFVKADLGNTDNAAGGDDSTWGTTTDDGGDGLWCISVGSGSAHPSYDVYPGRTVVQADGAWESVPNIVTTISGLTPGSQYDIRALYGCHSAFDNTILAGLVPGSLSAYDKTADVAVAGTYEFEGGVVNLHQALLGTASANASGEINVYIGATTLRANYEGLSYEFNSVPEPGTMALLGTALIGLLAYAWQKRT
jgi:hypothetical protein